MNVLNTESGSQQGDFHLIAQAVINSDTKLGLKITTETVHKFLYLVHLIHHQFVLRTVRDVQQYFLGVEYIVVV